MHPNSSPTPRASRRGQAHSRHPADEPPPAPSSSAGPDLTLGGVAVLRWPAQAADRDRLAATGKPRLLLVEDGQGAPFVTDPLENWVRDPFDPADLDNRLATLAARARRLTERPRFDADGLLWMGDRWVNVPDAMRPIVDVLVARLGQIVRRDEIVAACSAAGMSTRDSAVKGTIRRLDQRFAQVGLELHNVRDRGYLLQASAGD
jgi:hypothetical protein